MSWQEITREQYEAIFHGLETEHGHLCVFASETDMSGYYHDGKPYMMTEWSINDAEDSVLRFVSHGGAESFFKLSGVER